MEDEHPGGVAAMRLRSLGAALPCAFARYSLRLRRSLLLRPAVDCCGSCAGCPWNRAEQRRRLARGRWRRGADGLLRLHFPPAGETESGAGAREKEERT